MASGPDVPTLLRAVIAASGYSRRKAFTAIREGRIVIDGRPSLEPSSPYTGGEIRLDGRTLKQVVQEHVYLMLNKPAGVITTVSDTHARQTVLDLVPVELRVRGLHPVGRLDRDTTGLLLLTNDGSLTYRLTHPSHEVEKEYWFSARPPLGDTALGRLRAGIEIDSAVRQPADLRRLPPSAGFEVSLTIREGRKRQVRRMVEALGSRVSALARVREGPLTLAGLEEGRVRRLTKAELTALGVGVEPASRRETSPNEASRLRRSSRRR
jgi:pseudouridine synthase